MKAIIFDVFGTLIQVVRANSARVIISNIRESGAEVDEEQFISEWRSYYALHTTPECGFMTEREIFTTRIQMFYDRYGVDRNAQADNDALLAAAFHRTAYDDVVPALNALKKRFKILIGSNTDNDILEAVMKKNGITADDIYTSESLRCYKPDPRFFSRILDANCLQPQDVIFVGDNPRDDISGPKQLGIKTVLIDRNGGTKDFGQDYTISDLNELIHILSEEQNERF